MNKYIVKNKSGKITVSKTIKKIIEDSFTKEEAEKKAKKIFNFKDKKKEKSINIYLSKFRDKYKKKIKSKKNKKKTENIKEAEEKRIILNFTGLGKI